MAVDYNAGNFWLNVLVIIVVAANTLYTWWSNREKVTSRRFAALEKEVAERLSRADLEAAKQARDRSCTDHRAETGKLKDMYSGLNINIANLPNRKNIDRLHERLDGIVKLVSGIEGEIKGMSHTLDLLQEHHIKEKS